MPSAAPGGRSTFCAERRTHGRLGVKTPVMIDHESAPVQHVPTYILTEYSLTQHMLPAWHWQEDGRTLALRPLHNGSSRGLTRTPGTPGPPRQDQATRGPCRRDRLTIPLRPSPDEGQGGLAGSRLKFMFQRRPG